MAVRLSAIVVAFGKPALLGRCLAAIEDALARVGGESELIVVANDGSDSELSGAGLPGAVVVRGAPGARVRGRRRSRARGRPGRVDRARERRLPRRAERSRRAARRRRDGRARRVGRGAGALRGDGSSSTRPASRSTSSASRASAALGQPALAAPDALANACRSRCSAPVRGLRALPAGDARRSRRLRPLVLRLSRGRGSRVACAHGRLALPARSRGSRPPPPLRHPRPRLGRQAPARGAQSRAHAREERLGGAAPARSAPHRRLRPRLRRLRGRDGAYPRAADRPPPRARRVARLPRGRPPGRRDLGPLARARAGRRRSCATASTRRGPSRRSGP